MLSRWMFTAMAFKDKIYHSTLYERKARVSQPESETRINRKLNQVVGKFCLARLATFDSGNKHF